MSNKIVIRIIVLLCSFFCVAHSDARLLKSGMSGDDVKTWQLFLIKQRLMKPPAYGNFAGRSVQATIIFQKKYRLSISGIVDSVTVRKAKQLGYIPFVAKSVNRLGKYIQSDRGKQINIIELRRNGEVFVQTRGNSRVRGYYMVNGNTIKFKFSSNIQAMDDKGVFKGDVLYTYLHIVEENGDPGDYNPLFPNGYPHKKQ